MTGRCFTSNHTTQPHQKQVDPIVQGLASLPPSTLGHLDLYHPEAQRLLRVCNWQAYLKDPPPEGDGRCRCG